ncbi:Uncharacterised protein [Mycobacteroides abscessus subsp. abscessus]|nr:Uncharacterised protein [Mycobacteroides abscessus subsp. abscessus]
MVIYADNRLAFFHEHVQNHSLLFGNQVSWAQKLRLIRLVFLHHLEVVGCPLELHTYPGDLIHFVGKLTLDSFYIFDSAPLISIPHTILDKRIRITRKEAAPKRKPLFLRLLFSRKGRPAR